MIITTRVETFSKNPTIYSVLKAKLGREPSHKELVDDVKRILDDVTIERAEQGKLRHQRRA